MNAERRSPAAPRDDRTAWQVRDARPEDAALIADFNRAMAHETESLELDAATLRAGVDAVLAEPAHGFYLVARDTDGVAGALLVTREWSDWRNGCFWWIQSVYVVPRARRRGAFRALHAEVRRRARADGGVCGVRLYVASDNGAAKRTYAALGMRERAYAIFEEEFQRS